jgi:hypothetical protein
MKPLLKFSEKMKKNFSISLVLSSISLPIISDLARALPQPIIPHPIAAKNDDISVTGDNGKYMVRMPVKSSRENAWKVLTGYTDLPRFIPELISSKIVKNNRNQKILDQIYSGPSTFGLKAKIRVNVMEVYLKKLDITLVNADYLKNYQGSWSIESSSDKSNQLILIHKINIDPKIGFAKELFFQLYKESLSDAMTQLKKEIESRT